MEIPQLNFGQYCQWQKRNDNQDMKFPGVYAIAITEKNLDGCDVGDYSEVVYIGQTTEQSLEKRLNQFNRSINSIEERRGHSGGRNVHRDLGDYQNGSGWGDKKLFVAVMPVKWNIEIFGPTYLEKEAFKIFKSSTGKEKPKYNQKI